jgi:thymidylate synthase complementing protein thyX
MELIKPSWEILEQESGIDGIYKAIERAGRTCYKSEDKITENSAKPFVDRMIKSGHGAMLEHGTVYLAMPMETIIPIEANGWGKYTKNPYSKGFKVCEVNGQRRVAVTTNLRVLVENDWLGDLQYICEPTEYHEKRVCVRYVSDIHFYKDITRHRVFSWAIESTRFCNYMKQKFGSSISFATPIWLKEEEELEFEEDLRVIESLYFKWIKKGWQPQQAAYFLIQGTKAEIIMTGFISDYKHFFDLRSEIARTGNPHPTVVELIEPLRQEFIKRGLV